MFIHNATSLNVSLARGHVTDEIAIAAVVVSSTLRVDDDGLVWTPASIPRGDSDPPIEIARLPLWQGVSVTASGAARGPRQGLHVCPVVFRIGVAERRLIVFRGPPLGTAWGWSARSVGCDAVRPDRAELHSSFWGQLCDLPPGPAPRNRSSPHPGVKVEAYPLNDLGVGFYPDERAANGGALPNVERPDQLVRRWNDTPDPAGFTPCRELVRWRMAEEVAATALAEAGVETPPVRPPSMRVLHHAPAPSLIFDDVAERTLIELQGIGERALRFSQFPRLPPS